MAFRDRSLPESVLQRLVITLRMSTTVNTMRLKSQDLELRVATSTRTMHSDRMGINLQRVT